MPKNKASKPPKSRPASTSALAQPATAERAYLTAFAADAALFAFVSQAVDRHRIRVYACGTSAAAADSDMVADHVLPESVACHSIAWVSQQTRAANSSSKAKRRKGSKDEAAQGPGGEQTYLAVGTAQGTVLLFSPHQSKVVRVLAAAAAESTSGACESLSFSDGILYGATGNGRVQSWDLVASASADADERVPPSRSFTPDTKTPVTLVSAGAQQRLVTAHHALELYSMEDEQPSLVAQYTGHITPVTHVAWVGDAGFVSAATDDRHLYYWDAAASGSRSKQPRAMLSLDAPVRHLSVSPAHTSPCPLLLVVTERGSANLYKIALPDAPKKGALSTFEQSASVAVHGASPSAQALADGAFYSTDSVRFARLVKGVKVVLDDALLRDGNGHLLPEIALDASSSGRAQTDSDRGAIAQRYKESASASAHRAEVPQSAAAAARLSVNEAVSCQTTVACTSTAMTRSCRRTAR